MADPRLIDLPLGEGESPSAPEVVFHYDPAVPECWLAAERVIQTLAVPAPWTPTLITAGRPAASGAGPANSPDKDRISEIASSRGLLPFRPPSRWTEGDELPNIDALLACTFAKQAGKAVAFSLALMRQIWCAGRDPGDHDTIMLAGAASEIHPNALAKALELKALRAELERAGAEAASSAVTAVPAVRVGTEIFVGDAGLEAAAAKIHG